MHPIHPPTGGGKKQRHVPRKIFLASSDTDPYRSAANEEQQRRASRWQWKRIFSQKARMGLVSTHARCPTPMAEGRAGGRGEDRFSLRSYEVPSTSLDPREVSLLSPSRRPYLSSSRSTTYTTITTLPSRTVSLRITDAVRSLPRTSSTRGSAQFRSWNRRALVSPEISTPDQTIVYYFFLSNFSAFLTLL